MHGHCGIQYTKHRDLATGISRRAPVRGLRARVGMGPQRARGLAPEGAFTHGRGDRPMVGRCATNRNERPARREGRAVRRSPRPEPSAAPLPIGFRANLQTSGSKTRRAGAGVVPEARKQARRRRDRRLHPRRHGRGCYGRGQLSTRRVMDGGCHVRRRPPGLGSSLSCGTASAVPRVRPVGKNHRTSRRGPLSVVVYHIPETIDQPCCDQN